MKTKIIMDNPLKNFQRNLSKENINSSIEKYLSLIEDIPTKVESHNILDFLTHIKRKKVKEGPYPNVSLFEAANRIMSDLVILYGVKELLDGKLEEIQFGSYRVNLGNEKKEDYDIQATDGIRKLRGEAFNVAPSFFQGKKSSSLRKMKKNPMENILILLMYNADAVELGYTPKREENIFHLPVKLSF